MHYPSEKCSNFASHICWLKLTPWNRILLMKLAVKKFHTLRRFKWYQLIIFINCKVFGHEDVIIGTINFWVLLFKTNFYLNFKNEHLLLAWWSDWFVGYLMMLYQLKRLLSIKWVVRMIMYRELSRPGRKCLHLLGEAEENYKQPQWGSSFQPELQLSTSRL
jgi:hypothetical protein